MARKYEMSWEGHPAYRWVKMYRGVRYRVTCEELNAPLYTQEASYRLANEWWHRKLAELTKSDPTSELRNRYKIADLEEKVRQGQAAQLMIDALRGEPGDPTLMPEEDYRAYGQRRETHVPAVAAERDSKPIETDLTLESLSERYLAVELARAKEPGTYGDLSYHLTKLLADCRPLSSRKDGKSIDEATMMEVYGWLRNETGYSAVVQRKVWNYFRRFIRFLWAERIIDLPRNLDARGFTFDVAAKEMKIYNTSKIHYMLASLPDRLRLYALLALNCGMYGVDMAQIRHEEYQNGRIRLKRSKTRKGEDVPEVDYLLWPETRELLDKWPRTHPEFLLTSKTGTPLWRAEIRNGKKVKVDLIGLQWHRGRGDGRASKPPIPLKALRSVAATILESHREYGRYVSHYLGHSTRMIKDRHYTAPSRELFDEILGWLRAQILGEAQKSV